ncbi:hypothetical protein H8B09_23175 [Paenibacillus sp. PR3]|uniref:Uncharacterized protein n=1 Tax=Paenibacillus terricola TaxID=2763503 RepID=A0ABR8N0H3_9BACL|nr:hypothetical protein [Paenibacillus terricola]MBD3921687.1 hypothetical protein [Paenibacillus terricola]
MVNFGLAGLIFLTIIVVLIFFAFELLGFINPTVLQIQLLGIHVILFGVIVLLAFEGSSGYGLTLGIIGLVTGIYGSFREPQRDYKEKID